MLHSSVFNTSEACHAWGVRHAVLSPGSRNAPLTISFARNEKIRKWIVPDERAAGFIALGIAQKLGEPVALCCTSGTALLNYAPAVAEAFYREIPLIVLSADRPPELVDQRDGQTIRQFNVLQNHVKVSIQLPLVVTDTDGDTYREELARGLGVAHHLPKGPVHINIPFKEPFYPDEGQELVFSAQPEPVIPHFKNDTFPTLSGHSKVLVLVGQHGWDKRLSEQLNQVSNRIPVIYSPLNNLQADGIMYTDLFLKDQEALKPDLLITAGLSVLSKNLKRFLRSHLPKQHLHFDPAGVEVDTYRSQPQLIRASLADFMDSADFTMADPNYLNTWRSYMGRTKVALKDFMTTAAFSETTAFQMVLDSLPAGIDLHFGNSMPVRFGDLFGIKKGIITWCNRGTSGIDGCVSTAVGTSLVSDRMNVLLTGDLSLLYDRNAFFHQHPIPNLRIVVLNNQGGGIFRLIEGPSRLPELEAYFETRHTRTAEYICAENNIEYVTAESGASLHKSLADFYKEDGKPKLLEIFTDPVTNQHVFSQLKKYIHEQLLFNYQNP